MFVSPGFIGWNLTPQVMIGGGRAFGRCLGHDSGAAMNGIDPQRPYPFCRLRTQGEGGRLIQEDSSHQTDHAVAP